MINPGNRDYLINLPRNLILSYVFENEPFNMLMVHGSVKAINDYMVVDYPEEEVFDMMRSHQADVLLCGHTHKPFHRVIKDVNDFKHVVNIGSVGKPKDGDPRICYAILELNQSTSTLHPETIKVSFKRVEYDIEKAAKAVEDSLLPKIYAEALRIAK